MCHSLVFYLAPKPESQRKPLFFPGCAELSMGWYVIKSEKHNIFFLHSTPHCFMEITPSIKPQVTALGYLGQWPDRLFATLGVQKLTINLIVC